MAAAIRKLGVYAMQTTVRSKGSAPAAMQTWNAVDALMALAHETRLAVFRLLVRAGPDGVPAGTISATLAVTPSTLSHHLAMLERAGLLKSRRHRRQIFYACAYDGMRGLLEFLTTDCCEGNPEICGLEPSRLAGKKKANGASGNRASTKNKRK